MVVSKSRSSLVKIFNEIIHPCDYFHLSYICFSVAQFMQLNDDKTIQFNRVSHDIYLFH